MLFNPKLIFPTSNIELFYLGKGKETVVIEFLKKNSVLVNEDCDLPYLPIGV